MDELTIDQLAQASGLSVRNIRSHHTRGLLPPPTVRGRTGYYGDEHLARLKVIQELQEEGLSLGLVQRLLTSRADTATRLLDLRRTVMTPFAADEPLVLSFEELTERFGEFDEPIMQAAFDLGAIVPRADGRFTAPLPGLLNVAEQVVARGVSLASALVIAKDVQRHCEAAADRFVQLIHDEVWEPFDAAGRPDDEWPRIAETIEAVRPLATQVFAELLKPTIAAGIERAFGEEFREQAEAG